MRKLTRSPRGSKKRWRWTRSSPDGAPHPMPGGGELLRGVTEALTTWSQRPARLALAGPSAQELAERLDHAQRRLLAARAVVAEGAAHDAERRVTAGS